MSSPDSSSVSVASMPCAASDVDEFLSQPTPEVVAAVASMPGPVLVLGAGGKMGLHLCKMLRKAATAAGRNLRVVAVSRFTTLRDRDTFTAAGIEALACDLAVPEEVLRLPGAGTLFFMAGVKFGTAASPELLHQMNVVVPQLVAERYAGIPAVVFSTGCVYPFVSPQSGGASEAVPPQPVGAYAESCLRREEAFAGVARSRGTPVVLIRLNYSVEFRYGVLVDIATNVLHGQPTDVTMGHVNLIWQGDAVAQIIRAHSLVGSPAVPLNVTGPEIHRVRDLAHRFGELFQKEARITGEESSTAWLSDASKSHAAFGRPPTTVDTMQRWIAAWLASGGSTWGKPTGFEKRDGKF